MKSKDPIKDIDYIVASLLKVAKKLNDTVGVSDSDPKTKSKIKKEKESTKLSSGEKSRAKETAAIYRDVFASKLPVFTSSPNDDDSGSQKSLISKLFGDSKGIIGLAAFGVGIYFIINSLIKASTIDMAGALKAILVVSAFTGLFLLLAKQQGDIIKSSVSFAIFSATISYIVLPLFKKLKEFPLGSVELSIIKLGLIFIALSFLIKRMSTSVSLTDVAKVSFSFGLFSLVLNKLVLPLFFKLEKLPFFSLISAILKFGMVSYALYGLVKLLTKTISLTDITKLSVAFGLLGFAIGYLILPALIKIYEVDSIQILIGIVKFGFIFYALAKLTKIIVSSVNLDDMIKMSVGFGLFSLVLSFLILPMLQKIANFKTATILEGLLKFGLVFIGLSLLLKTMVSSIDYEDVIKMSISYGLMSVIFSFVIIPFLYKLVSTKLNVITEAILKFGIVFTALSSLIKLSIKLINPMDVLKMSLTYGLLGLMISYILIPMLNKISSISWETVLVGLGGLSLALLGLTGLMGIIGAIVKEFASELIIGTVAILGIGFVIDYLIGIFRKISDGIDWKTVYINLGLATLAVIAFGAVVAGIGALLMSPAGIALAVGAAAITGLAFVMDLLVESITNIQTSLDPNILNEIGKSLLVLSAGLLAFSTSMVVGFGAGVLDSIAGFFGFDLVSKLKKFEKIDGPKLAVIANAIDLLTKGLISFKDTNLSDVNFDSFIDSINKFQNISATSLLNINLITSVLKSISTISGSVIESIGIGCSTLAQGLYDLSNVKLNLNSITSDIQRMTLPLLSFSLALMSFSNAYKAFDDVSNLSKTGIESKLTVNNKSDIQQSIYELQQQEYACQEAQLNQLILNGEKLDQIIFQLTMNNTKSTTSTQIPIPNPNKQNKLTYKTNDFSTKNQYMDNMKLMTGLIST